MTTPLDAALARIAALEARVSALEGGGASSSGDTDSGGGVRREQPLADAMLDKPWANKKITRDPKKWNGPTQVGKTLARAPIEWLELWAASLEYKAHMGRQENPPRLSNKVRNGKPVPWHESDSFEAKLVRGWIERKKKQPKATTADTATGDDDDFNFGANAKDAPSQQAADADDEIGF